MRRHSLRGNILPVVHVIAPSRIAVAGRCPSHLQFGPSPKIYAHVGREDRFLWTSFACGAGRQVLLTWQAHENNALPGVHTNQPTGVAFRGPGAQQRSGVKAALLQTMFHVSGSVGPGYALGACARCLVHMLASPDRARIAPGSRPDRA